MDETLEELLRVNKHFTLQILPKAAVIDRCVRSSSRSTAATPPEKRDKRYQLEQHATIPS